jgi:hypothetical protein
LATENDKQIELWLEQVRDFKYDTTLSEQGKEHQLKGLVEQIRDRLDDPKSNFTDAYVDHVMNRLTELIDVDSLPD